MNQLKIERPKTVRTFLMSAGHHAPVPTLHRYSHSRRIGDTVEHLYRCAKTGATRVWGCDGPNEFTAMVN